MVILVIWINLFYFGEISFSCDVVEKFYALGIQSFFNKMIVFYIFSNFWLDYCIVEIYSL